MGTSPGLAGVGRPSRWRCSSSHRRCCHPQRRPAPAHTPGVVPAGRVPRPNWDRSGPNAHSEMAQNPMARRQSRSSPRARSSSSGLRGRVPSCWARRVAARSRHSWGPGSSRRSCRVAGSRRFRAAHSGPIATGLRAGRGSWPRRQSRLACWRRELRASDRYW